MKIIVTKDYGHMSKVAGQLMASFIRLHPECVLGLATGSSPVGSYGELIRQYQEEHLDFSKLTCFNLDEYVGLDPNHEQSYRAFMSRELFSKVNMTLSQTFIPSGMAADLKAECQRYEAAVEAAGGIDLQLLGIGRNGHIGFNEPDVKFEAHTHVVQLKEETIQDNARFFETDESVPRRAISVGMKTILQAKKIVVIASGLEKAEAVLAMVSGDITTQLPASILQLHPDATLIIDEAAATRIKERGISYVQPV